MWIVYGILHSWLAHPSLKEKAARAMGKAFVHYRLMYTLFALIGFVAILLYQLNMDSPWLFASTSFTLAAGILITGTGLIIMVICIRKYFLQLSGITSLYRPMPRPASLEVTGIHRFVRHPLYLGTFIFIWGLLLLIPVLSLLVSNTIITIYTLVGIYFEEQKLVREFGESYRRYQREVPRIIPSFRNRRRAV